MEVALGGRVAGVAGSIKTLLRLYLGLQLRKRKRGSVGGRVAGVAIKALLRRY